MSTQDRYTEHRKEMFAIMEKYLASGLSQKKFCQQENMNYSTFQSWYKKYRERHNIPPKLVSQKSHFIAIHEQRNASSAGLFYCQIEFPTGIIIKFAEPPTMAILTQLLQLRVV